MTLLLLRHGESEGNVRRVIQGWSAFSLTARGRAQAETAGRYLATLGPAVLYSSPLPRARETAEAVARHTGLEIVDVDDVREYHFGEAEGLTWDEAAARWGLAERDWGVGTVPGEEGIPAFQQRVARAIDALIERHANDLAVCVVHGGVLGATVAHLCRLALGEHAQIYSGNCSITAIEVQYERPVITALNHQCHLRAGQIEAPL
jgi:broad specificity phosphatase PhoE